MDIPAKIMNTLVSATDSEGKPVSIKFKEYIIGLRNGIAHFGQKESLVLKEENDEILSVKIKGTTKNNNHTLHFKFEVKENNQILAAIDEILKFIKTK